MKDEYEAFIQNKIRSLVPLPPGRKIIRSKWVWRVKMLKKNALDKRKLRVMA